MRKRQPSGGDAACNRPANAIASFPWGDGHRLPKTARLCIGGHLICQAILAAILCLCPAVSGATMTHLPPSHHSIPGLTHTGLRPLRRRSRPGQLTVLFIEAAQRQGNSGRTRQVVQGGYCVPQRLAEDYTKPGAIHLNSLEASDAEKAAGDKINGLRKGKSTIRLMLSPAKTRPLARRERCIPEHHPHARLRG